MKHIFSHWGAIFIGLLNLPTTFPSPGQQFAVVRVNSVMLPGWNIFLLNRITCRQILAAAGSCQNAMSRAVKIESGAGLFLNICGRPASNLPCRSLFSSRMNREREALTVIMTPTLTLLSFEIDAAVIKLYIPHMSRRKVLEKSYLAWKKSLYWSIIKKSGLSNHAKYFR